MNYLHRCTVLLFAILLAGCVSTIDNGPKLDKQKAVEANVKLGMNYLQKNERDRALRAFSTAQDMDAKSAEAMAGIAMVHQLNGETELADQKFRRAMKLRADFSMSSIELSYSRFLFENGRCADARPYLEKASADITYPSRGNALYLLGLCSLALGDSKRARGAFEHALNISKSNAPAALELAEMQFDDGEYSEAKRNLDLYSAYAQASARSLWLGIRIERIFGNKDKEASYALALKNLHPYSQEYLDYKNSLK
ncbi:type IV pilus biogenesis/stability protein PilW [Agaribacterium haliotis]|uniref:type IV pilus biogenesis/stability protein PilW n=1 Tax=Agaribacterium haliotis TaxID=2013869 RepID=UPI000BB56B5C|nr:type IV pilus biogenesis/stability protein PilW [Agaribacterium haliotis]